MKKTLVFVSVCAAVLFGVSAVVALTPSPVVTTPIERKSEMLVSKSEPIKSTNLKLKTIDLKNNSILLSGPIDDDSANKVILSIRELNKHSKSPIYLLMDSPGGSVLAGARIISEMQSSKSPVHTVCLQLCASMSAMILEYGEERYAVDRSIIMFHPASMASVNVGELDKIVSRLAFVKRYVDKMDFFTATRSGMSYEDFKAKSSREYWLDAEDAYNSHLIDSIVKVDLATYTSSVEPGQNLLREKIDLVW